MLVFFVKNFLLVCLLIGVSTLTGCSRHPAVKVVENFTESHLDNVRVFQKEKLAHGGNLLVVPFSAGANVEASDELDRVSLMIVKGVADALDSKEQPFKLLVEQDAQNADFVIKGRIVQIEEHKDSVKLWQRKIRKFRLQVEATVLAVESDEVLAKFSWVEKAKSQETQFEGLGYAVGVKIGQFLLNGVSK